MPNQRKYIDIPMPSDPDVSLTDEQLALLFPNRGAGEAFCKLICRLAAPAPHLQNAIAPADALEGLANGR